MSPLWRWIAPPVFPGDAARTRSAIWLNTILLGLLAFLPVIFVGDLIGGRVPYAVLGVIVCAFLFALALNAWLRKGRVRLAAAGVMVLGFVTITASAVGLGMRAPNTALYLVLIIVAAMEYDLAVVIATTAICSLTVAGLIVAENAGLLPHPDYTLTVTQWISYTAIFAWIGSLCYSAFQSLRQALARGDQEIAERKRMARDLLQSEMRFRALVEHGADAISLIGAGGQVLYQGPTVPQLTGHTIESRLGQSAFANVYPDDLAAVRAKFARLITRPSSSETARFRSVRQDGSVWWTEGTATNLLEDPSVRAIVVNYRDITERRRAEEALRKSEERFRVVQEVSLDAFTILKSIRDERGQIVDFEWTYANPAAVRILKPPQGRLVGERLLDLLPGNRDHRALFERYVRIVETGHGDKVELEYHAEGISGWFRNMATKLEDGVAISFADITERKKAEQDLAQLAAQLQAQARIVDLAHVIIRDAENRIVFWNTGAERLYGWTRTEAVGQIAHVLLNTQFPNGLEAFQEQLFRQGTWEGELTQTRRDGTQIVVASHQVVHNDEHGQPLAVLAVNNDITDLKLAERQLAYLGTHDALTAVYNRAFFETELARLEHAREYPVSIIVADLDNMKATNDTYGHAAGDELIKRAARALQTVFRASDILARIGGDEFALILPKTDAVTAEQIRARIRENMPRVPGEFPDLPWDLSLGVATSTNGKLADTFKLADNRMYADKRTHKALHPGL